MRCYDSEEYLNQAAMVMRSDSRMASARLADRMAGPFATIERFFERLFERPAARLFQPTLEPIHLQRHLERAMEEGRPQNGGQGHVPHHYRVRLHPSDLTSFDANREALAAQLGERLHAHARRRGYTLAARPRVELESSMAVEAGDVVIEATPGERSVPRGRQTLVPSPTGDPGPRTQAAEPSEGTMIFRAAQQPVPSATLALRVPGQPPSRVPVRAGTMRIGRSMDNDIVLADDRVSRRHGQIGVRMSMLVYTDLGSTNGSYLNGNAVTEIALGPGDILQLGSSTLTIEPGI